MSMSKKALVLVWVALASVGLAGAQKPQKLQITDIKVGTGPKAAPGDIVIVRYAGKLTNGKVFDSNMVPTKPPFAVRLGQREVIEGWDKGLVGMQVGGERRLIIPPSMGYGSEGAGEIPGNATLDFTVKCLDLVKKADERVFDKTDLKVGTGKTATATSKVTIAYKGTLSGGFKFDEVKKEKPLTFSLNNEDYLKAFRMGMVGMKEGGKRRVRIPPAIGFGEQGLPPNVPGKSVLYFEIELLKVN